MALHESILSLLYPLHFQNLMCGLCGMLGADVEHALITIYYRPIH